MTHQRFEIDGGATLRAGQLLRALAEGARVPSEAIGPIRPLESGAASLTIANAQARLLTTPMPLAYRDAHGPALLTLRRPTDLPRSPQPAILLLAPEGAPLPNLGPLSLALADAFGISQEAIGFILRGHDFLRIQLPLTALLGPIPAEIGIQGHRYRVESLLKKT